MVKCMDLRGSEGWFMVKYGPERFRRVVYGKVWN